MYINRHIRGVRFKPNTVDAILCLMLGRLVFVIFVESMLLTSGGATN